MIYSLSAYFTEPALFESFSGTISTLLGYNNYKGKQREQANENGNDQSSDVFAGIADGL